jgi:NAD(P)-dependent dehydrogenase (short-subunit alcohol dehydrogenase family)
MAVSASSDAAMDLLIGGKVALVTGGGSGIGRATSRLLAAEGARVMVADIDAAAAAETARLIADATGIAAHVAGDVSRRADAERYVGATLAELGQLDILVNNAGLEAFFTLVDTPDEVWEQMMAVNAKGPYMTTQYAAPAMMKAGGGVVVNIASGAALRGNVGLAAYSAAKAALVSMTRCLAVELAPFAVRVNAIAPGLIDTPTARRWIDRIGGMDEVVAMIGQSMPTKRAGRPEEVAAIVALLASPISSYVNGVVVPVDGGMSA